MSLVTRLWKFQSEGGEEEQTLLFFDTPPPSTLPPPRKGGREVLIVHKRHLLQGFVLTLSTYKFLSCILESPVLKELPDAHACTLYFIGFFLYGLCPKQIVCFVKSKW